MRLVRCSGVGDSEPSVWTSSTSSGSSSAVVSLGVLRIRHMGKSKPLNAVTAAVARLRHRRDWHENQRDPLARVGALRCGWARFWYDYTPEVSGEPTE